MIFGNVYWALLWKSLVASFSCPYWQRKKQQETPCCVRVYLNVVVWI